jgi:hypothetical protein
MHGSRAGPHLSTGDDYREGHTIVSVLNHTPVSALRKKTPFAFLMSTA